MKEVKPPKKPLLYYAAICAVVLMLMNALVFPRLLSAQVREVGYSDFLTMLDEGKIDTVELADDRADAVISARTVILARERHDGNAYKHLQ